MTKAVDVWQQQVAELRHQLFGAKEKIKELEEENIKLRKEFESYLGDFSYR